MAVHLRRIIMDVRNPAEGNALVDASGFKKNKGHLGTDILLHNISERQGLRKNPTKNSTVLQD